MSTNPGNPRAEDVVAFVDAHWGGPCAGCSIELVGHDGVLSLFLGFSDAPRCVACLAQLHGRERAAFLRHAASSIRRLACFRAGWEHADRRLASASGWPEERLPAALRMDVAPSDQGPERAPSHPAGPSDFAGAEAAFDAGDRACGELALELKRRLGLLSEGERLHLIATDLGAREDLPAWCRLTGHRLVRAEPPHYLIARRSHSHGESP